MSDVRRDPSEAFSVADRQYWEARQAEDAAFEQYYEEDFLLNNPGYYDEIPEDEAQYADPTGGWDGWEDQPEWM